MVSDKLCEFVFSFAFLFSYHHQFPLQRPNAEYFDAGGT